jgi:hypothetical protein
MAEAQGELPGAGGPVVATPERPHGGAGGQLSPSLPGVVLPEDGEVVSVVSAVSAVGEKTMPAATYSRAHKKKGKDNMLSVRKSSRHNKASVNLSVLEKAKRLAADKNLDPGTPHSTSLDSLPDARLSNVLVDSCILFNPSRGSPCEILDLVRARELAQASIAAAALKKEREEQLAAAREAEVQVLSPEEGPMATTDPEGVGPSTRSKPKRAYAKRPMLSTRKGRGTRAG